MKKSDRFRLSIFRCFIFYYTPKLCIESSVVVLFTYLDNDVEQVLRLFLFMFMLFFFSFFFLNWRYPNVKMCNLENWFSIHALHCAALEKICLFVSWSG